MKFRYLVVGCIVLIAVSFLTKIIKPTPVQKKSEAKNIIFEDKSWQKLTKKVIAGGAKYSSSYSLMVFPDWKVEHIPSSNKEEVSDILSLTSPHGEELGITQHDLGGVGCTFSKESNQRGDMYVASFVEITTQSGDLLRVTPRSDIDGLMRVCWKRPQGDWITNADFGTILIKVSSDSPEEARHQIYLMLSSIKKLETEKR